MATKDISDLQVVLAYFEYRQQLDATGPGEAVEWPYDILVRRTGQPEKVCYRAMERADRRGLLEYGVSLRTGWVTDAGRELVKRELGAKGIEITPEMAEDLQLGGRRRMTPPNFREFSKRLLEDFVPTATPVRPSGRP